MDTIKVRSVMMESPTLQRLGVVKKLGCGTEGCVYLTERGTAVKTAMSHRMTRWGQLASAAERAAAERLMQLQGKHSIVPVIYGVGDLEGLLSRGIYIEREPLNDLQLSEEAEEQFLQGELGMLLSAAFGAKKLFVLPRGLSASDRKVLTQIGIGYSWLQSQGLDPQDHNTPDNWGQRADGSVALRDFGHIELTKGRKS